MANSKRPKRPRSSYARGASRRGAFPFGRHASEFRHVTLNMEGGKVISMAGDKEAVDAALEDGELPFSGEVMTCILCGKKRESAPDVESDWRAVVLGEGLARRRYYGCADHFPPNDGSREAFKAAYVVFMTKAIGLWQLGAKVK